MKNLECAHFSAEFMLDAPSRCISNETHVSELILEIPGTTSPAVFERCLRATNRWDRHAAPGRILSGRGASCRRAEWPIGHGLFRHRKFSILKYGEDGAYQRALAAREAALQALSSRTFSPFEAGPLPRKRSRLSAQGSSRDALSVHAVTYR